MDESFGAESVVAHDAKYCLAGLEPLTFVPADLGYQAVARSDNRTSLQRPTRNQQFISGGINRVFGQGQFFSRLLGFQPRLFRLDAEFLDLRLGNNAARALGSRQWPF